MLLVAEMKAVRHRPPAGAFVVRGGVSRADDIIVREKTVRIGVLGGNKIDVNQERGDRVSTSTWTVGLTVRRGAAWRQGDVSCPPRAE